MSRCKNEGLVCENGGSCWDKADGSSECVCFGGYTGFQCEYPPDDTNQGNMGIFIFELIMMKTFILRKF